MFTDFTSGMPFVKSGRLHAMAVSTAKRSELVPDLPSMEEVGTPDFDINSWNGYFGPAGMSPDVRSEEHTSELQSLMRISYAVFCLKKKTNIKKKIKTVLMNEKTTQQMNQNSINA